ncbi:histidinol-phosphatase HisJ [Bacillus timonensis]|nr:histidinol-phosphatase HisJ [Bacillus timonensis]
MLVDGHVHTPFCPHGTNDSFEDYISQAINLGYKEISFTEHAPLPKSFFDPTPDQDSGMKYNQLNRYLFLLGKLKEKFRGEIKINIGLEIDYIEGYEDELRYFLDSYGKYLDDSILSVHFLKFDEQFYCIDYSSDVFGDLVQKYSVEGIYEKYYDTILQSIKVDVGSFKPKRIGHLTLVHKFQKRFPCKKSFHSKLMLILDEMANQKLQIDYNGAGSKKPLCLEPYPSNWIITEAIKRNIPLVYGSDAHSAKDLKQGFEKLIYKEYLNSSTR